ncbi:hypothetical protein FYM98_04890 [Lactobacillus salivarius]|uniref:hypothetical protein n=1 Tax=Ligilactobacillus salivarius TaxID=1624 RepID=UPI0013691B46|nr:hypothetical protein [Ligilactobacillus salivarius]MYU58387.1 hypothetical protein [Ligilactobacillus salivarius]MYU83614.1 hypothetical protein [Ligilactobacillus salivarius]MYU91121.1 hypothetical protein [Ligilactobacillus salivarius]
MKKLFVSSMVLLSLLTLGACSNDGNKSSMSSANHESSKNVEKTKKQIKATAVSSVDEDSTSVVSDNSSEENSSSNNNSTVSSQSGESSSSSDKNSATSSKKQFSQEQIAALASWYTGNIKNSKIVVHNMGNYNAVSDDSGNLLFAYSVSGDNVKVGGFGDKPWDEVNISNLNDKASQQGQSDNVNSVANNTTFTDGY